MLRATLQQLSFWQVKEFRWDRVAAHFRLPSARVQLLSPLAVAKWVLLVWWLLNPLRVSAPWAFLLLGVLYAGESGWFLWEIVREIAWRTFRPVRDLVSHGVRRPRVSPRSGVLFAAVAIAVTMLASVARGAEWPWSLTLLALDRGLFAIVAIAVLATVPLTAWKRRALIRRAAQRIRAARDLKRVGITGSFGKSSTKEFLATLTGERFQVLKTPANINTDIGIAQVIVKNLSAQHTLFVCEMGAYRTGEIARAANLVRPTIGILTAVRNQHLALFGSLEELTRAKGELLRALPKDGIAVVNGDDPTCVRLATQSPAARIIRYGLGEGNDVRGEALTVHRDRFELTVRSTSGVHRVTVPLLGGHHAGNVLSAWAAAEMLGVPGPELAARAALLRPLPRTMEPRIGPRGTFLVDDTYSANPDGIVAALEYLPAAAGKITIVVLATMIELGKESAAAHRRVGKTLSRVKPDLTVVTARDFADSIIAGASGGADTPRIVVEPNPERAFALVEPHFGADTVVLLEGRVPDPLRQKFLSSL